MIGICRSLSTPKLLTGIFLLAALLIYSNYLIRYVFFDGGMWGSLAYALRGALVIAYLSMAAVLIFTNFAAIGRASKFGPVRFIAPLIALLMMFAALILIVGRMSSQGTIPLFLLMFGSLGFIAGRSQAFATSVDRQLIDAGFLVAAILVLSKTSEYVVSGYSSMDGRLLLCAVCYAVPIALIARITANLASIRDLVVGLILAFEVYLLLSEPYLPLRFLGGVILPYIQTHTTWSYWALGLAGLAVAAGALNIINGYRSVCHIDRYAKGRRVLQVFWLVTAYSAVILLDWKYSNEAGVQELIIVATTLWITVALFGAQKVAAPVRTPFAE